MGEAIAETTTTTDTTREEVGGVAREESRAVAVARPVTVAHSDIAVYDTAQFDQMWRLARVFANSWLLPETITHGKVEGSDKPVGLAMPIIEARAFMIIAEAREMEIPPLAYAQCVSFIKGRLAKEGKLVNAIVRKRTGVELEFRFGLWDTDHIVFPPMIRDTETGKLTPDETFLHGAGERLAIRCFDPARPERFVDGCVGIWKTTGSGSPWSRAADWPRQLRYRAVPEWARAYEPGAILGIYTDAEDFSDDFAEPAAPKKARGTAAKLAAGRAAQEEPTAGAGPEGFNGDRMATEAETVAGGTNADAVDVEVEEIADETKETARKANGDPPVGHDTLTATDEQKAFAAQLAKIAPDDEETEEAILLRLCEAAALGQAVYQGHAEEGEVYLFAGLPANEAGKWLTFKDGARNSLKGKVEGLKVYAIHAPAPGDEDGGAADEEGDITQPCEYCGAAAGEECKDDCPGEPTSAEGGEAADPSSDTATDGVQPAEPEPATSEPVTPASTDGARQAEASGPSTAEAAQTEAAAAPEAETGFLATLAPMTSWLQIKAAASAMMRGADWAAAPEADKDEVRRGMWAHVERVRRDHKDPVDQADDVSAFGMWLATMPKNHEGAQAVEGTFATLKRECTVWKESLTDPQRAAVQGRVDAFLKASGRG